MRRGTTPINTFTTDISLVGAEVIFLTYQQGGETVIEIPKGERMTVTEDSISVQLTQEETLRLDKNRKVKMQIRAGFADGNRVACDVMEAKVEEILKDGEI